MARVPGQPKADPPAFRAVRPSLRVAERGEPLLAVATFALDLGAGGVALGPGGGLGGAEFAELLAKRVDLGG